MDREKILDKIRKLLALGRRSPNPEEAATALAAAQRLMQQANVSAEEADAGPVEWVEGAAFRGVRTGPERDVICALLEEFFFVRSFVRTSWDPQEQRDVKKVILFGRPENVKVGEYIWIVLRREMSRLVRINKPCSPAAYLRGVGWTLQQKLRESRQPWASRSDETAIVATNERLDQAFELAYPSMGELPSSRRLSSDDWLRGSNDGDSIELSRPLPSPEPSVKHLN